jgi:hypothetical protein
MDWTSAYWDALTQLYWTPKYLGLKSIPRSEWGDDPEYIRIPRSSVSGGRAIYVRAGNSASNLTTVRGLEETLNHIFDLALALIPDSLVGALFHSAVGIEDEGPFTRWGRELTPRFWGKSNVTQHDGFVTSDRSALGIELKLGASTSKKQLMQYLALLRKEEILTGPRESVGLLYVTPGSSQSVWADAGLDSIGSVPADFFEDVDGVALAPKLREFVDQEIEAIIELSQRIVIGHMSWEAFDRAVGAEIDAIAGETPAEQTLQKLLTGFRSAIQDHHGAIVK